MMAPRKIKNVKEECQQPVKYFPLLPKSILYACGGGVLAVPPRRFIFYGESGIFVLVSSEIVYVIHGQVDACAPRGMSG